MTIVLLRFYIPKNKKGRTPAWAAPKDGKKLIDEGARGLSRL